MRYTTRIGVLLLIVLALGFGAIPAVQALESADLELVKTLDTDGQIFAGDQVVWILTLTNKGPDEATTIVVTEDLTGLGEYTLDGHVASAGTFDPSGGVDEDHPVWSINSLAVNGVATLTLTTTIAAEGDPVNSASVTATEEDPVPGNNDDSASAGVGASITAEIDVKPETLNLGSRGVITVFIRFEGDYNPNDVNLEESLLVCNGAQAEKLHVNQKNGGTLMAKFRRLDLEVPEPDTEPGDDDTAGDGTTDEEDAEDETSDGEKTLTITCEGTIQFGDETVEVSGIDTVRVTGEKKKGLGALLARFLDRVLPIDDETDEAAETGTATPTPDPEQARNRNQQEKGKENGDLNRIRDRTECTGDECPGCTGDCSTAPTLNSQGNGKKSGTSDDTTATGSQGNGKGAGTTDDTTATGSQGNGNQGNGNSNQADSGNGRGNSGKPEKEQSNGKK
jgi:hypothetical protein